MSYSALFDSAKLGGPHSEQLFHQRHHFDRDEIFTKYLGPLEAATDEILELLRKSFYIKKNKQILKSP